MTDFTIILRPNVGYYKEAYSELLKTKKLKRYEPLLATIMILFGLALRYFDGQGILGIFPFIFSALGVYELVKFYYSKHQWVNDRTKSSINGQAIQLNFSADNFCQIGPFTKAELKWSGIKSIKETDKGLILIPETGISIYLPKSAFQNQEQIDYIIKKIK